MHREAVCDGLNTVRNLAAFHVDVLSPQLSIVLKGIIREVKNPRSSVSRLAMHTLDDLYMNLGKLMDPVSKAYEQGKRKKVPP